MSKAIVLIEMAPTASREAVKTLGVIPGVTSVDQVTGSYDIIVRVDAPDLFAICNIVTGPIHTTRGVIRTVTCLVI